jgi:hypothetical protein
MQWRELVSLKRPKNINQPSRKLCCTWNRLNYFSLSSPRQERQQPCVLGGVCPPLPASIAQKLCHQGCATTMAQPWQQFGGPAAQEAGPSSMACDAAPAAGGGDEDYGRLRSVDDLPPALRPVFIGSFRWGVLEGLLQAASSFNGDACASASSTCTRIWMHLQVLQRHSIRMLPRGG